MYCTKCGEMLPEGMAKCDKCGSEIGETREFCSCDYMTVEVERQDAAERMDSYEALGWQLIDSRDTGFSMGHVSLNFKRDRKIRNKTQLVRLQNKLDDAFESMRLLETQKGKSSSAFGISFGTVSTLIFGGGMCLCLLNPASLPLMIAGCAIGALGIALCGANFPICKKLRRSAEGKLNPLIAKKREEAASICEEAQRYL